VVFVEKKAENGKSSLKGEKAKWQEKTVDVYMKSPRRKRDNMKDHMVKTIGFELERYPELDDMSPYGTSDHIDPIEEKILPKLQKIEKETGRKFLIDFEIVEKKNQPPKNGWRWSKWGPYIGEKKRQAEYLYDEPEFDTVLLYHIYEIIPDSQN